MAVAADPGVIHRGKRGFTSRAVRYLFFGMVLVATMIFRPQGLLGSARHELELKGEP